MYNILENYDKISYLNWEKKFIMAPESWKIIIFVRKNSQKMEIFQKPFRTTEKSKANQSCFLRRVLEASNITTKYQTSEEICAIQIYGVKIHNFFYCIFRRIREKQNFKKKIFHRNFFFEKLLFSNCKKKFWIYFSF